MKMCNIKELSIYIHIPFCKQKCFYCDFLSFNSDENDMKIYKNLLIREIADFAQKNKEKYIIKTIFIGGGTPSMPPVPYIADIMDKIYKLFNVDKNAEITIEINPDTLTYDRLLSYKKSGINRISIGVQAYQNRILKDIGRIHTIEQFMNNYENIYKANINNVNIDLMFSLPNQNIQDLEETLEKMISLKPTHFSVYSLIIEKDTPFYNMLSDGKICTVDDETDRKMYYLARDVLSKNGYDMYEISNFCKKDMQCRHNIVYWTRKEYIGFGLGASSLINNTRIKNTTNFDKYIKNENRKEKEELSLRDMYSEFIFLGLRMKKGININEFKNNFGISINDIYKSQLEKFIKNGLLIQKCDTIFLSNKGIDVSNTIFLEFI